ncbi:substance-P receptor-like [Ruditapes philippinarum]|uniref:substance-P receptor-like n=1 Tax=Ruditapes philippinarum TaxID=129788 RepID=UPI00295B1C2A|nr:substance-P receptor-like [Ruditapes philippinarum]
MNNNTDLPKGTLPDWVYVEQVAFSGIIALIGTPGNILIILVFSNSPEKSSTDYMVFAMAISDLLGSIVCTTLNILRHIPVLWENIGSMWFCRAYDFFTSYTVTISAWVLGVVAIDRYMKTCRPLSDAFSASRIKILCKAVYILVLVLLMPSFGVERFDVSTGACLLNDYESVWSIFMYVISFLCCVSYIITAVAYIRIAVALGSRLRKKQNRNLGMKENTIQASGLLQEQKKVNRTTVIMFLITLINVFSVVLTYFGYLHAGDRLYLPEGVREVLGYTTHTTYLVTYIANPILYIMMSSKFREGMRKLFQKV